MRLAVNVLLLLLALNLMVFGLIATVMSFVTGAALAFEYLREDPLVSMRPSAEDTWIRAGIAVGLAAIGIPLLIWCNRMLWRNWDELKARLTEL